MPRGRPTTMPVKMSSDMPLPMPRSVICSPSHMMKAVPAVSVMMHSGTKAPRGDGDHVRGRELVSVSAMAKDWMTPSRTVT